MAFKNVWFQRVLLEFSISGISRVFFICKHSVCVCTYTAINLPYSVCKLIGKYNKLKSPLTDENTLFYSRVTVL